MLTARSYKYIQKHQKTSVFRHVHWTIILEKQMYELTINDQPQNINHRRSCIINILPLNTRLGGMQEEKYNNYHSKAQHHVPNNNQPKTLKSVELQVNISIGKNKFLLQVHRCSHLHQEVLQFLKLHQINLKYEGPILAMVREELSKKQIFKDPVDNQMQELKKVKSQMENKRKLLVQQEDKPQTPNKHKKYEGSITNDQAKQNKQNYSSQYNSNTKHGISTGQSEAQSHVREVPKQNIKTSADETKCQNVYERWKVKQKIKETERIKNTHPTEKQGKNKTAHFKSTANEKQQDRAKEKSASHKKLQSHSPDYFYKKGIKFRQAKQVHVEEMYKDKYPFQIKKQATITPTKKDQLHERLFKQYELREKSKLDKHIGNLRIEKEEQKKPAMDKYKQKIIERDHQIDKALGYLISNKMIENPYKIENVSKSPFRKINLCNP